MKISLFLQNIITVYQSEDRSDHLVHLLYDVKTATNIRLRLVRQSHHRRGEFRLASSNELSLRSRINYFAYTYIRV